MNGDLTHASFFSGVGGVDLGLERAGWRTVSFSEIDEYASTVLRERWPHVPNLGDIAALAEAVANGDLEHDGLPGRSGDDARLVEPSPVGPAGEQRGAGRPVPDAGTEVASDGLREFSRVGQDGRSGRGAPSGRFVHRQGDPSGAGSLEVDRDGRSLGQRDEGREGPGGTGTDLVRLAGRPARRSGAHGPEDIGDGDAARDDWRTATLWTGGFPCQDLSVAGKRRGLAGERSGLAYAFLGLVERYRPPAIMLENVPGLLSSNEGRDLGALLRALGELGYWWAYRILDARWFGVPQRRRRVFIVGIHASTGLGPDSAAEVLSVGSRCGWHPATGDQAGSGAAGGSALGLDIAGNLTRRYGKGVNSTVDDGALVPSTVGALNNLGHHGWTANAQSVAQGHVVPAVGGPPPDADGMRAADGLASGLDDQPDVADAASASQGEVTQPVFVKAARAQDAEDSESWVEGEVMPTLNAFDVGDTRTTAAVIAPTLTAPDVRHRIEDGKRQDGSRRDRIPITTGSSAAPDDDPLLPLGLDSHRYRCCGNGVVSDVAEWIGFRLAAVLLLGETFGEETA